MKKLNKAISILCALMMAMSLISLPAAAETTDLTELYKKKDVKTEWSAEEATVVDLSALTESLVITEEGEWVLSGETSYPVIIEAGEKDDVRLILNGVTINSSSGPAIYEKTGDKVIITLAEGTVNTLTDQTSLKDGDDTIAAPLYTEDDLSINGNGTLIINGTTGHGINCKADLIIASGNLRVTSVKDGIRARNSVLIMDGKIVVAAQGDGITATREDKEGKGWIVLAGGNIQITTGEGAGEEIPLSASGMMNGMDWGNGKGGRGNLFGNTSTSSATSDGASVKGVKAATDITVMGGTLVLDCEDDGLHANNITITGGNITISTGDDGMHADTDLVISGGTLNIPRSHEGLEGYNVTVSGGDITILSDDDGINAAGGKDSSGLTTAWGGRDNFNSEMDNGSLLSITGGTLSITAGNDGLDSNGSVAVSGGVIGIWTATNQMDGSLDYNGTGTMTGGTVIIANSITGNSMSYSLNGTSFMSLTLESAAAEGTEIILLDAAGKVIGSFAPQCSFQNIIVASSLLEAGAQCSIMVGGEIVYSGAYTANVSNDGSFANMSFGNMGGFGGGRGGMGGNMGGNMGGDTNGNNGNEGGMPTMPDGTAPDGNMPTLPDGTAPDGNMPTMPDGTATDGGMPGGNMPGGGFGGGMGGGFGGGGRR